MHTTAAQSNASSTETPAAPNAVFRAAQAVLDQCRHLVASVDDRTYAAPSSRMAGGTIGKHVRHSVDHFAAALGSREPFDYDRRQRDVPMETDRAAAERAISEAIDRLAALGPQDASRPVRVRVMLSGSGDEAVLDSTMGREIAFAAHHAVHHHAMIRSIVEEHGGALPASFGKAPSTIAHERSS